MPSIDVVERELPLIQRAIVDNCFEEGHYESGIGVLDKLRGQRYKPSPQHIRQLLYISLYPLPPKPPKCVARVDAPPPSPQKIQLQQQKDDLWPKPASRPLAIALLEAFAKTNTPESLMRGLPFHSYVDNDGIMDVDPFRWEKPTDEHTHDHSPIRDELLAIQDLKDCWGLLRNGVVKRKQADRYRMDEATVNPESEDDDVVGSYAWPVLEWLINVFEQDEKRAGDGQALYSALLLCQIPAPRSKRGPRWDVEIPLRVAYACLSAHPRKTDRPHKYASSEMRIDLGMRLISLLLNLTSTKPPLVVPSDLLRLMGQRLLHLPSPSFEAFLSAIPLKHISFKVSLLESYISQGNPTSDNNKRPTGTSMAPVPRAKPKFNGKGIVEKAPVPLAAPTGSQDKAPFPIPELDHILNLISSPLPSAMVNCHDSSPASSPPPPAFVTRIALAKFHLISALCTLHLSRGLADPQWTTVVREGKLRNRVLHGFTIHDKAYLKANTATNNAIQQTMNSERETKGCLASALEMISLWEASSE